ncbi:MAG: exo-alpha-sialidase [Synergistaceae bacterium]|nr:exo-alpha-sialidase [Synergistaceae bacterium]
MERGNNPKLINPKKIDPKKITGRLLPFDSKYDNKPTLAYTDKGKLVMTTFHQHTEYANYNTEWTRHTVQYTSPDWGETWDNGRQIEIAEEPSLMQLRDGTLLALGMGLHPRWNGVGIRTNGKPYSADYWDNRVVYRSEDAGQTWAAVPITVDLLPDEEGFEKENYVGSLLGSYSLLELNNGIVLINVYTCCSQRPIREYLLRSYDKGKSWIAERMTFSDDYINDYLIKDPYGANENVLFYSPRGKVMMFSRTEVDHLRHCRIPGLVAPGESTGIDQSSSLLLFESPDGGATWKTIRGFGVPGMMYPSVVKLDATRMLITYTMRMVPKPEYEYPYPHMGVHAVIAEELPDGTIDVDFGHDIIVIDDLTPDYATSGGGFGKTVRLPDGSLLTPYSYRYISPRMSEVLEKELYMDQKVYEAAQQASPFTTPRFTFDPKWPKALVRHLFCDYFSHDTGESREKTQILKWRLEI